MVDSTLEVEVAYASVERQVLLSLRVAPGTTVLQAVEQSGIVGQFPEAGLLEAPMGIFGRRVAEPDSQLVEDGDRVEIYRALVADPMEVRRMRAAKTARPSKKRG